MLHIECLEAKRETVSEEKDYGHRKCQSDDVATFCLATDETDGIIDESKQKKSYNNKE